MKYRVLVFMIMAAAVWADPIAPCQAGTVADVLGQGQCSIGALVFNFTSYTAGAATHDWGPDPGIPENEQIPGTNTAPDASAVAFQPLGTGFRLTGTFWSYGYADSGHFIIGGGHGVLNFQVSTADGNPVGLEIGTAAYGAFAETSTDPLCEAGSCNVNANASSVMYLGNAGVDAGANVTQWAGGPAEQVPYGNPASALLDPFSSESGLIIIGAGLEVQSRYAPAWAEASLNAADYWFTERPVRDTVPEPATWALVGLAGLPLLWWRARRAR